LERNPAIAKIEANKQVTGIEIIKAPRQRTESSGGSLRRSGKIFEACIIPAPYETADGAPPLSLAIFREKPHVLPEGRRGMNRGQDAGIKTAKTKDAIIS